jgi:hypothetical protein
MVMSLAHSFGIRHYTQRFKRKKRPTPWLDLNQKITINQEKITFFVGLLHLMALRCALFLARMLAIEELLTTLLAQQLPKFLCKI